MDTVTQSFNDMSMAPELLNQYSEHAKAILPAFSKGGSGMSNGIGIGIGAGTSAGNGTGTGMHYEEMSNRPEIPYHSRPNAGPTHMQQDFVPDIHDLSPEEQMHLMQKIQNNEYIDTKSCISERTYNPNIQDHEPSQLQQLQQQQQQQQPFSNNYEQYSEPMNVNIAKTEDFSLKKHRDFKCKILNKLYLFTIIFIIIFILGLPKLNSYIIKLISKILTTKNSIVIAALKSVISTGIIITIIQLLDYFYNTHNLS